MNTQTQIQLPAQLQLTHNRQNDVILDIERKLGESDFSDVFMIREDNQDYAVKVFKGSTHSNQNLG